MLTMDIAIKQAIEYGATKYAINFMNKEKKELEFSFIHFFNDDGLEIGYFTFSLRQFCDKINIFENGRIWGDEFLKELEQWTNIKKD